MRGFFFLESNYSGGAVKIASFDAGKGKDFEQGKLSLEDLRAYAVEKGEPTAISGQQELIENIINRYI